MAEDIMILADKYALDGLKVKVFIFFVERNGIMEYKIFESKRCKISEWKNVAHLQSALWRGEEEKTSKMDNASRNFGNFCFRHHDGDACQISELQTIIFLFIYRKNFIQFLYFSNKASPEMKSWILNFRPSGTY